MSIEAFFDTLGERFGHIDVQRRTGGWDDYPPLDLSSGEVTMPWRIRVFGDYGPTTTSANLRVMMTTVVYGATLSEAVTRLQVKVRKVDEVKNG